MFAFDAAGEPLNDEAWHWYDKVVGEGRGTVIDTWWQTGKERGKDFGGTCVEGKHEGGGKRAQNRSFHVLFLPYLKRPVAHF